MLPRHIPIAGSDALLRDTSSMAVINHDTAALKAAKKRKANALVLEDHSARLSRIELLLEHLLKRLG